jgi:hypothetical protein
VSPAENRIHSQDTNEIAGLPRPHMPRRNSAIAGIKKTIALSQAMPNCLAIASTKNRAIAFLTQRDRPSPKTNQRDRSHENAIAGFSKDDRRDHFCLGKL